MPAPTESQVKVVDLTTNISSTSDAATALNNAIQAEEAGGWRVQKIETRTQNFGSSSKVVAYVSMVKSTYVTPGAGASANITVTDTADDYVGSDLESVLVEIGSRLPRIAKIRLQATVNVTTAATSQTIALSPQMPAGGLVLGTAWLDITTLFSGGGSGNCTVKVGDASDDDGLITSSDIFTGAATGARFAAGAYLTGATGKKYFKAATTLNAIIASDVNVSTLTAGDVWVKVPYVNLSSAKLQSAP
jgi:hypothetical protein